MSHLDSCWICRAKATIRVLSGVYSGEGFPSCDDHRDATYAHVFKDFHCLHPGYEIVAYAVVWGRGGPGRE